MRTVVLLTLSNVFMTIAWYGHLRFKAAPMWIAILASWAIAFFEYCFQVPANRIGYGQFTVTQLKIIQEVITLVVFCGFVVTYMHDRLRWNDLVGLFFVFLAVVFVFGFSSRDAQAGAPAGTPASAGPETGSPRDPQAQ